MPGLSVSSRDGRTGAGRDLGDNTKKLKLVPKPDWTDLFTDLLECEKCKYTCIRDMFTEG